MLQKAETIVVWTDFFHLINHEFRGIKPGLDSRRVTARPKRDCDNRGISKRSSRFSFVRHTSEIYCRLMPLHLIIARKLTSTRNFKALRWKLQSLAGYVHSLVARLASTPRLKIMKYISALRSEVIKTNHPF